MGNYAPGIDISHWQGQIDFTRLAASGEVQFVYIKATDGSLGLDPRFRGNWSAAKAAGLPRGAYHFFRPSLDISAQIRATIAALGVPGEDAGELPPALDVEVGPFDHALFDNVLRWVDAIEAFYERTPVLYMDRETVRRLYLAQADPTDLSWWNRFTRCPLWLADYTEPPTPPAVFPPWPTWSIWQHTPQGTAPGVPGAVDLDWAADLAALVPAKKAT